MVVTKALFVTISGERKRREIWSEATNHLPIRGNISQVNATSSDAGRCAPYCLTFLNYCIAN